MDSTADKYVEVPKDIYKAPDIPTVKKLKRKQTSEEKSPMLKKAFQILTETSSSSTDS